MSQTVPQDKPELGFSGQNPVGRIVSMVGSKAIIMLRGDGQKNNDADSRVDIGSLLAIETVNSLVLALVSGVSVPMPDEKNEREEIWIAELELMGELPKKGPNALGEFKRGVSVYPAIGDLAFKAGGEILLKAYNFQGKSAARIGTLLFDKNIPAFIQPDKLLGNHFAILGATGTGKSCSVALLLRAILQKNPNAHIILLDPHSEYSRSFGSSAEVVTPRDLNMPFWLLTFDEIVEVLIGQNAKDGEEAEILGELIPKAKKRFAQNKGRDTKVNLKLDDQDSGSFSVDTPVPYRMSDLMGLLDENIGKLDQRKDISPFKRLKTKIESISQDPRYSFMFGSLTVNDTMSDILGRLFRVPVDGKPICIFELTGFPSEVVTVVVSVLCRMTFDFGVWSDGNVPITLVCEEAHRYVPSDKTLGFEPVKRSISRIAKEGRKYSVSLGVVTQRPAEIDPTILAQCNTLFSLRMANDRDQEIVKAAISDAGASLLDILPSLGNGEAIVFGEGVALPARIKLDPLPPQALPKGQTADFTKKWGRDVHDFGFLEEVVVRWREQDIHKPLALKYSEDLSAHGADLDGPPSQGEPVKKPDVAQAEEKSAPQVPPVKPAEPPQMKPVAPEASPRPPQVNEMVPQQKGIRPAPPNNVPPQQAPQQAPQAVLQAGGQNMSQRAPQTEQSQAAGAQKTQPQASQPGSESPAVAPPAQNGAAESPGLSPGDAQQQNAAIATAQVEKPAAIKPVPRPQAPTQPPVAPPVAPQTQAAPQAPAAPQPVLKPQASLAPQPSMKPQAPISQAPVSQAPVAPQPPAVPQGQAAPQVPASPPPVVNTAPQPPAQNAATPPPAPTGQPSEPAMPRTQERAEPPALQSGLEQEAPKPDDTPPSSGAPIPGYQRLG